MGSGQLRIHLHLHIYIYVYTFTFTTPEYKCRKTSTCDRLALISLYSEIEIERGQEDLNQSSLA